MNKVKLIAHRGESALAPENTREAYELAWRKGAAWGAETDVYLTSDGVLVCMHDTNTLRTGGVDWVIGEHTLAEIRTLDVGAWKGSQWFGCRVPTLREVLATLPPEAHIFVEIKLAGGGFPRAFTEALEASGARWDQVSFISFESSELQIAGEAFPNIDRFLLCVLENDENGKPKTSADELVARMEELNIQGIDVCHAGLNIDRAYADKFHAAGYKIHCWTVDEVADAKRMIALGVDSITTNRPSGLAQELSS